jgi:hypothetical protein
VKSALLTTTGLLLSTAALATGCGGGGSDTMRATLTDDGCAYEGDTTPAPGLHTIEVENKTSHLAGFRMWKLARGKSAEDVQHAYTQALAYSKRPRARLGPAQAVFVAATSRGGSVARVYAPPDAAPFYGFGGQVDPEATSELALNVPDPRDRPVADLWKYSGRFVIVCFASLFDTRTSSSPFLSPSAVYVATELDVR